MDEKKVELFVVFQEKLAVKIHDQGFREEFLAPLLYSGVTEQSLDIIVSDMMKDEEISGLITGLDDNSTRQELKLLLKKLIERFSKFNSTADDDYIG